MTKNYIRTLKGYFVFFIAMFLFVFYLQSASASEFLYVKADMLTGRYRPDIHSNKEAYFSNGELVEAIDVSKNGWVEVYGGESGTVWCKAEYLSSVLEKTEWKNYTSGSVYYRAAPHPEAKRLGKIRSGKEIVVSSQVFGWGYIENKGWVNLEYFEQINIPVVSENDGSLTPLMLSVEEDYEFE